MKNNKKILLVEDDIDLGEETAELLVSEGYDTDFLSDPLEAEGAMDKKKYDFILMDYKMPGMDGLELLRIIRKKNYPAKVVVISGKPFIRKLFEDEGMSGDVSSFLIKPFDYETLLEMVRTI